MENQLPPLLLILILLVPLGVCGPELQLDAGTEAPLGGTAHLRCQYTGAAQVTQVTWDKLTELGPQMVAVRSDAHGTRTHPFYGTRARFQRGDEHGDASLLIDQLVLADAGHFRCKVFTFPAGSFEGDTWLTVLVPPQVWLVPGPRALLEGDRRALVAMCMVMGSPPVPEVRWDMAVEGEQEVTDTANANGTVTVTVSLYVHPERDMKGKDAVCIVNHSSLAQPLHVPYKLNIYHVPEVAIKRSFENWQADMEGAALQCEENGNPPATDFVWKRTGGPLPSNLTQDGSRLLFTKRLTVEDSGTYVCEVSNEIGSRSAQMKITISDRNEAGMSVLTLAFVAIGVVGLVIVLIFIGAMIAVNRSHRKKTEQMVFKLEEISTMSRQPSIRRCNSMSASVDVRLQEAGGSRDIDQLEQEPMMEEMVPQQRSSSRDLLAVAGEGQFQPGTHRYSLRSTTSEPRSSHAYPFGAYRNSLPNNQRHSLRDWMLDHSERSGSPGEVPENSPALKAALEQVSSLSTRPLTPSPSEQGSQTEDEEEVADRQKSIHAAMGHFYPHNGTLRAKPGNSTVYIARKEHCV
ncbi:nectin-4 isoform X1 [Amblyraja radiata]|uniref:nectin-4 isoform X1 n=1 Tax=Amblyraja radiata TaxID=386614 RepID=UPI001404153B|nr:nectin-4 isoform X1 [Amblyraja radiata]